MLCEIRTDGRKKRNNGVLETFINVLSLQQNAPAVNYRWYQRQLTVAG